MAAAPASSIFNISSLNLLRFGALTVGLYWGWSRQRTLTHQVAHEKVIAEKKLHKELVEEGKIAFAAYNDRKLAAEAAKDGVITDVNSYKFDSEKYINWMLARLEAESAAEKPKKK
ncbi:hypothetical protein HK098_008205 [Nowakowskiella sp. JEL0407]|nr:hypothetical protein HK098_008205 [Nowakowskiella sp. JEL0407]